MPIKFNSSKLLLATNNFSKVEELRECFQEKGYNQIQFLTPKDFELDSPEETEESFEGNAKLKAKYYGEITNLPALGDDTGICVEALNGKPGVHTADWLKDYKHYNNPIERVIDELRKANFYSDVAKTTAVCSLALYWPDSKHFKVVTSTVKGYLNFKYKNDKKDINGKDIIGFRGIFVPEKFNKPLAQLNKEDLKKANHRILALKSLIEACF